VERILGYSPEEFVGTPFRSHFLPEDLPLAEDAFVRNIRGEELRNIELRILNKDKKPVSIGLNATPIRQDGKIIGSQGAARDITERKKTEALLRASEAKLKSQFKGLPVPVYAYQKKGDELILVDCNAAAVEVTQGRITTLLGGKATEIHADRPDIIRYLETCFEEKRSLKLETRYHFKTTGAAKHLSVTIGYVEPDMVLVHTEDITARKEIEEKLSASEARLRTILESVPFDLLLIDENGRYVMQNAASKEAWGDVTGKRPEEVTKDPETLALWLDNNRRAFSGEVVRSEASYKVMGKEHHIYNIISPVYSGDGIHGITIVNIDITERKLAEKALKESEEKYRFLVENTGTAVSFWDTDGKLLLVNRIAAHYLGSTPEQMIGKTVHDFLPKDQADRVRARQQHVLRSGAGMQNEEHLNTPTGERWFRSFLQPVKYAEERYFGVQIVSHDVTELMRAERALRESDARLRLVVSQLPAVLWTIDPDLRFTYGSGAGLAALNLTPDQVLGKSLYEYFKTDDPEFMPIAKHRISLDGEAASFEMNWNNRVWETHTEPLRDENGKVIGCLGLAADVTERKLAEEEVKHSREQLRALAGRLHEVREEESASIAREVHDELGQALTGLKFDLDFIRRRLGQCEKPSERAKLDEKIKEMYAAIDAELNVVRGISTRLRTKVLDDLGLIGAMEMYAQEFHRRTGIPCDVNQYGVEVMESDLDSQRKTAVFRILQEILTNVRRHAAATHVWVDLRGEDESFILEVRDNGKGIPPETLKRIDGLGILGMRERAQVFGGHVKIDSEPGKGTSVSVTIPLGESP
jgi:PAS domain S-box-containing protein